VGPYALTKDGRLFRHTGITSAGFGSGERCEGTGEPEKAPPVSPVSDAPGERPEATEAGV
jgi:hypothetical protein